MENKVDSKLTVNEAIKQWPATTSVFTNFSIDSCCGGAVTIEEAATRDGAPLDELLSALNKIINN